MSNPEIGNISQVIKDYQAAINIQQQITFYEQLVVNLESEQD